MTGRTSARAWRTPRSRASLDAGDHDDVAEPATRRGASLSCAAAAVARRTAPGRRRRRAGSVVGRWVTQVVSATAETSARIWAAELPATDDDHPLAGEVRGPAVMGRVQLPAGEVACPGYVGMNGRPGAGRRDDVAAGPVPRSVRTRGVPDRRLAATAGPGRAGGRQARSAARTWSGSPRRGRGREAVVACPGGHHPAGQGRVLGRGEHAQRRPHTRPRAAGRRRSRG